MTGAAGIFPPGPSNHAQKIAIARRRWKRDTALHGTSGRRGLRKLDWELGDWDGSLNNITIGESGQILSRHYKDQWSAYYVGRSFPMQFRRVDAKQTLTIVPK